MLEALFKLLLDSGTQHHQSPGTPRGNGGDMRLSFNVERAPGEERAFGSMNGFETNPTSELICGVSTGAEPICETTAATPNTQYFSTAKLRFNKICYFKCTSRVGSVASPVVF